MPSNEILDRVRALHGELKADPAHGDATRALETVMLEPDSKAHYKSLSDRLLELEVDHPKLAASIQSLVDLLNAAGL
ncbi:MAG TPA: hypothetical protein VGG28_00330 [Kofleriaceae bacterium]|jgi:hypothetical protein